MNRTRNTCLLTSRYRSCSTPLVARFSFKVAASQYSYERTHQRLSYTGLNGLENLRPQPRAPYAVRRRKPFDVNDDYGVLIAVYEYLLEDNVNLTSDIQWQAVTHKSFDHGKQPYNEKLALYGKTFLQMQASIHLLKCLPTSEQSRLKNFSYRASNGNFYQSPDVFSPTDYKNITSINRKSVENLFSEETLMPLIEKSGLMKILRWKPIQASDLIKSGISTIACEALYAIVGAVSLQRGAQAAEVFVQKKILSKKLTLP